MTSLDFGTAARSLARAAHLRGLVVPVFASPPSRPDLHRSIRRRNGSPVVSIRLGDRPRGAVLSDMIEGIVVANYLEDSKADLVRSALWLAIDGEGDQGDASTLTLRTEVVETAPAPPVPTKAAAA
ncbi:MAG: hypothetical protein F4Y99_09850 [Acidimicrobiaceae bacterium]|nr:hypothetical protein [Acidimicrobiaceae bacterium]MYF44272.1 hypothetical protein [Acidimicrobiaceae bacterium]MYJ35116.1 hypothetical protein [Acidimicrobiaceae bacterium]